MAKMIKTAPTPVKKFKLNDNISFSIWVPLQNIGSTTKTKNGKIIKINRKTVDAIDEQGNIWRVGMNEIH